MKDIKGYEGRYQVGYDGRVYSTPQDGKPARELKQEQIVRRHTTYRRVSLSKEGKVTRFQVHRLVAEAFVPNPDNKCCVNHIDNVGENNYYYNLEWTTQVENMLHSEIQGRQVKSHTLGGYAAGKLKADKAKKDWDEKVGNTYGALTIVKITDPSGGRAKGIVKCNLCGNTTERTLQTMISRPPKKCRNCRKR